MTRKADDLLILSGDEVLSQFTRQEQHLIDIVRQTYTQHSKGKSSLPFSSFLRFPDEQKNRIIALPALVEISKQKIAGIKWVASFPGNIERGVSRASASLILNNTSTGRPYCFMEASHINAHRTAASAALAVQLLSRVNNTSMAVIGCGPINYQIVRYVLTVQPSIKKMFILDTSLERAADFAAKCKQELRLDAVICDSLNQVVNNTKLVSFATNAGEPWVEESLAFSSDSLVLHISLRDIPPESLAEAYNVVDDALHVDREKTSIHLAHQGGRDISLDIHEIGTITGNPSFNPHIISRPIVYSPFGLGILDIAVGRFVYEQASATKVGTVITNFFSQS